MDDVKDAPPTLRVLGPRDVHPHLIAEAAGKQLRLCEWMLDCAGLRSLAYEAGHLANLIEQAAAPPWHVA